MKTRVGVKSVEINIEDENKGSITLLEWTKRHKDHDDIKKDHSCIKDTFCT